MKFLIFYWFFSLLIILTISTSLSGWSFIAYFIFGLFFYISMSLFVTAFTIIKFKNGYVLENFRPQLLYILLVVIVGTWLGASGDNGDSGGIASSNIARILSAYSIDTSNIFFTFLKLVGGFCLLILPIVFIIYTFFVLKGFSKKEQKLNSSYENPTEENQQADTMLAYAR